jgi:acetoin utilization deacetylase AcuC-like enzyme
VVNLPFEPGSDDGEYLKVIDHRVLPELDEFGPQVLLVSAGFDAHGDDGISNVQLTEECYELMMRALVGAAKHHCQGRVVSVLEGGYNLRALGRSVVRHLIGLAS